MPKKFMKKFDMRGAGVETTVGSMSGGNMQKVVIAREFSFDTPVLVIAQPTRGVDVGAIEFIHSRIIEKRNAGCAILLCSADLDEVFRLSDRIITMYEGEITGGILRRGDLQGGDRLLHDRQQKGGGHAWRRETNKTLRKKPLIDLRYLGALALSVVLALAVGAVIMLLAGFDPLEAYAAMLRGVFGAPRHIGDALQYAMVLCLCGLACVIGSRVGIFNVGGEGQLLLGGILACQVGVWLDGSPRALVIVCAALAAMAVGGLYALVPGVLKVKVKVNEVITTIMLNSIAAYLCSFLAKGPWKNANKNMVAATESLDARYWFGGLIRGSTLSTAIFAAAIIAFLVWYIMQKTARGFEDEAHRAEPALRALRRSEDRPPHHRLHDRLGYALRPRRHVPRLRRGAHLPRFHQPRLLF